MCRGANTFAKSLLACCCLLWLGLAQQQKVLSTEPYELFDARRISHDGRHAIRNMFLLKPPLIQESSTTSVTASDVPAPFKSYIKAILDLTPNNVTAHPRALTNPVLPCDPKKRAVVMTIMDASRRKWRMKFRSLIKWLTNDQVSIVFVIGRVNDEVDAANLLEFYEYGDIILGEFSEEYTASVRKSFITMRWFAECSAAGGPSTLINVNDDTIMNWPLLSGLLDDYAANGFARWDGKRTNADTEPVWSGNVLARAPVLHDPKEKYFENITDEYFPPYTNGPVVVFNKVFAAKYFEEMFRDNHRYQNDDASWGIMANRFAFQPTHISSFLLYFTGNENPKADCGSSERKDKGKGDGTAVPTTQPPKSECDCKWGGIHTQHAPNAMQYAIRVASFCGKRQSVPKDLLEWNGA